MLVPCPLCGPREAAEFHASGPPRERPDPATATPERWREYLYGAPNPAGWAREWWFHAAGCRRFLLAERHTVTGEFRSLEQPR